ncbi:hypothetical protein A6S26_27940 [Nostoc sp. ATCC 43529]|nr:hypothetical protein A6S26_27940 [Nostoc sp. ATCC 43529]
MYGRVAQLAVLPYKLLVFLTQDYVTLVYPAIIAANNGIKPKSDQEFRILLVAKTKSLTGVATVFPGGSSFFSVEWLVSVLLWRLFSSLMVIDEHRNNPALR